MRELKSGNEQQTFTPWSLSLDEVQRQFARFDFKFERLRVTGDQIAFTHPEILGCSMANELSARWHLLCSHCNETYGLKGSKVFNRLSRMMTARLPSDQLKFVSAIDEKVTQQSEINFLKSIFELLRRNERIPDVERHADKKHLRDNMLSALLSARKQIYNEYAVEKDKLKLILKYNGCSGYQNIAIPDCPDAITSTDSDSLYSTFSKALRAIRIIKKNIAWIGNPDSIKEECQLARIRIVEDQRRFEAPNHSEIAELERINARSEADAQFLAEIAVWKKLSSLDQPLANRIFTAITKLGLDAQKLWHTYKDIAGKDIGLFAAEVLQPSDQVLAAVDPEILFLSRKSGLQPKQSGDEILGNASLGIWTLRARHFINDIFREHLHS